MSRLLAIAVPIPQGNEENWQQFIRELKDNHLEEFQASRQKLNVRERTFFQQTPMGSLVIVTLEGEDPETAFQEFAQGDDSFTKWFVQKVKDVHGLDLAAPPPGPLPYMVVDSGPVEEMVSPIL